MANLAKEKISSALQIEKDSKYLEKNFDFTTQAHSKFFGFGNASEDELIRMVGGTVSKKASNDIY